MSLQDMSSTGAPGLRMIDPRGLLRWALGRIMDRIDCGHLTIRLPDGSVLERHGGTGGCHAALTVHRWRCLWRLLSGGDIGFAESYMDGDWSSPDLPVLLELASRNTGLDGPTRASLPVVLTGRRRHRRNRNTRQGSRRNIAAHYDLGNAFYAHWLDAGMSYSSALYADGAETLEAAQDAKLARIAELLQLSGGEQILEIGCGWGGLADVLAGRHGCHVTGLTLSQEQLRHARQRLAERGLDADLRLQDYRDVTGQFDRIVSIEMLEAVGEEYWPTYFATLRDSLRPGGLAVLQVITIDESRFARYRQQADFIQRYIFPGGMLPTVAGIGDQAARAGLVLQSVELFGDSYARTLADWRQRFLRAWPEIAALGFDTRFKRMWDYYLAYCEAGFRTDAINVGLYRLAPRPA